ncbi:MAG: NAD-dependent deacylase, partial [Gemmatimonadaceae bacterium]|nr:NAD-dependent deacylase [Chitinophagaceae bacterium]
MIITQNIDDLHERGGSKNIIHLHGEILKMRSEKNERLVAPIHDDIVIGQKAPDGAQYRPDIVWFEEPVPRIELAIIEVLKADIFVVVGTSLAVYPAAGLLNYASADTAKFIIDRKIPYSLAQENIIRIEKNATEGVKELTDILLKDYAV